MSLFHCAACNCVHSDDLVGPDCIAFQPRATLEALRGMVAIHDSVTIGQEKELKAWWLPVARELIAKCEAFAPSVSESQPRGAPATRDPTAEGAKAER